MTIPAEAAKNIKIHVEAKEGETQTIAIQIQGDPTLSVASHILAFLKFDLDQLANIGIETKMKLPKNLYEATEKTFQSIKVPTPEMLAKLMS